MDACDGCAVLMDGASCPVQGCFRAFAAWAAQDVAGAAHAALIKAQLGDQLIGHIARDATEIQAREKPAKPQLPVDAPPVHPRGRPRQGEIRPPVLTRIQRQMQGMNLSAMLADLPRACDVGSKTNSKGFKSSWIGYKLHLDVADGQIPIRAVVTSAGVRDSQVAIPLATLTAARVVNLYDLVDAAYCSPLIRQHSRDLHHIPWIDHNPRGGQKIDFAPHEAERFKTRTQVERVNARLKDEFGARWVRVRGPAKVSGAGADRRSTAAPGHLAAGGGGGMAEWASASGARLPVARPFCAKIAAERGSGHLTRPIGARPSIQRRSPHDFAGISQLAPVIIKKRARRDATCRARCLHYPKIRVRYSKCGWPSC